ncbi:hypothetical protein [Mesorhizobium sp. ZC-5]|uniref:hypothetical protein n=1 Tax=Mesorhizobium sp. ZC-5 TaxID=2986066 RepID=UPI0021E76C8D|nr:hypothetical protein [Mesorhizobium sp. ZC-5]MCV3239329.1 hypothetical protein [Mesorhizobium sp. ZC-5]
MTLLSWLAAALTTGFLYVMGAVPFAVWSGRAVYAGVLASASAPDSKGKPRPGFAATLWLVVLPACLIAYALFRGFDVPNDGNAADEWGQVLFLILSPCFGLIAGYGLGWLLGRDKARRAG